MRDPTRPAQQGQYACRALQVPLLPSSRHTTTLREVGGRVRTCRSSRNAGESCPTYTPSAARTRCPHATCCALTSQFETTMALKYPAAARLEGVTRGALLIGQGTHAHAAEALPPHTAPPALSSPALPDMCHGAIRKGCAASFSRGRNPRRAAAQPAQDAFCMAGRTMRAAHATAAKRLCPKSSARPGSIPRSHSNKAALVTPGRRAPYLPYPIYHECQHPSVSTAVPL